MRTCALLGGLWALWLLLLAASFPLLAAEEEGWNLPAAERVAEAEAAATRGDLPAALRVLQQFEADSRAAGTLAERSAAEARLDRLRLALARAHTRFGAWEQALPLLAATPWKARARAYNAASPPPCWMP